MLHGALSSDDARSSARVLRALGAAVSPLRHGADLTVQGRGELLPPAGPLHCGNSGTTARLLLGALAGFPFQATLSGDASLRRRPMRRVTDPLARMGAEVTLPRGDHLPVIIRGGHLRPLEWSLPVASAQIKSALLIAGVVGKVPVILEQPGASRDHTERLLRHFGFAIEVLGSRLRFAPTGKVVPFEVAIPGDPSSAAFLVAAILLADRGEAELDGVGLNPSRTGFIQVLRRMGAKLETATEGVALGEPIGRISARPSQLVATELAPEEVPSVIDEVPILAALASRARGISRFRGLAELRVKESDRLALLAGNLRAVGARAEAEGDDLWVEGGESPPHGRVVTGGDHRIAMTFAVLGTLPGARVVVDDPACAAVSFPGFGAALARLQGRTS